MRKIPIPNCGIYAIIDHSACANRPLVEIIQACLSCGIKIIQLRDKSEDSAGFYKNALLIRRLVKDKALFIINDRADIARLIKADGLHLGQYDIPVEAARKILGPAAIIGKSCHSLKQAFQAEKEGADYISIGPIFRTPTKPEYRPCGIEVLKKTCQQIKIPVVAIGGINADNIKLVRNSGAKLIAVVRAICKADNIRKAIGRL